jgi:hypothetical protein
MKIASVDYMPVLKIPSKTTQKDQRVSIYIGKKDLKKVKNESDYIAVFTMPDFQSSCFKSSFFNKFESSNFSRLLAAARYDDRNNEKRYKNFLGSLVDALV